MDITLAPELEDFVREKVESGQYGSATEVIADALSLLDRRDRRKLKALLKAIDQGDRDFQDGRFVRVDSAEQLNALIHKL